MSLRGQIQTIKRRLGVWDGRCPECHLYPDVPRFIIFEPIGGEMTREEIERKEAAAERCPTCGQPKLTFIRPDEWSAEAPP